MTESLEDRMTKLERKVEEQSQSSLHVSGEISGLRSQIAELRGEVHRQRLGNSQHPDFLTASSDAPTANALLLERLEAFEKNQQTIIGRLEAIESLIGRVIAATSSSASRWTILENDRPLPMFTGSGAERDEQSESNRSIEEF